VGGREGCADFTVDSRGGEDDEMGSSRTRNSEFQKGSEHAERVLLAACRSRGGGGGREGGRGGGEGGRKGGEKEECLVSEL